MKFCKSVRKALAFLMVFTLLLSLSTSVSFAGTMQASLSQVTKTTVDVVEVSVDLGRSPDVSRLEWTFGGKAFSEWKVVDGGEDSDKPLITFDKKPYFEDGLVRALIRFDLAFAMDGTPIDDLSQPRSNRVRAYEDIGVHELKVTDPTTGNAASVRIEYTPYKGFTLYDEIKDRLDEILANNPYGYYTDYQTIGKSYEGRDLHMVIIAKDQSVVNNYLKNMPDVLENPGKYQNMLQAGAYNQPLPLFINNIHPDEHPGIDAQLYVMEDILTKKDIAYNSFKGELATKIIQPSGYDELARVKDPSKLYRVSFNVDELLDKVFFIFNLTENPDGRYHNTRQNARGFDVNRDNATQLQPESKAVVRQIAKWSPVAFLDLHGFVDSFLIEPCTPPHDPNYEYDIFMDKALDLAHAMGKAAIANTKYGTYLIAQEGEENWDDGAPNYTATYAMHHGALGSTLEMPDSNHDSLQAMAFACLEAARFVADNYTEVYKNQLEYFKRGVEGVDDAGNVDPWMVNKDNVSIGRPREAGKGFFPDYYVIPFKKGVKGENEVIRTVEYMLRNGIKVSQLNADATVAGADFKAGDIVIDMRQAKRGLANAVLWKGPDVSSWDKNTTLASGFKYENIEMYAELVLNFPALRGFECYPVHSAGALDGKLSAVANTPSRQSTLPDSAYVSIANTSVDTVKAVNSLLKSGVSVYRDVDGNFVVPRTMASSLLSYNLDLSAAESVSGNKLSLPKVYAGQLTARSTLQSLGFNVVGDKESADILIDDNGYITDEDFGKHIVILGKYALEALGETSEFGSMTFLDPESDYEALVKINIETGHSETAGYTESDYGYISTGAIITGVPDGAEVLITTPRRAFVSGWYPQNEQLDYQSFMFTKDVDGGKVTVIAGDVIRKEYNQNLYRLVTNAIFASVE